jgi:hypothetical protein
MKKVVASIIFMLLSITLVVFAGNDPSIKGEQRQSIQKAMQKHVNDNTVNGNYYIYDALTNDVKSLKYKKLHSGIVKKENFYVSCTDFTDDMGKPYDMDLLVAENNGSYKVVDSILHKVDGEERNYETKIPIAKW